MGLPTASNVPDLVFAYEETSGAARRVEGHIAAVLQHRRNHDSFRLYRLEVAKNPALASHLAIEETPCLIVLDRGVEQARLVQPQGAAAIREFLSPWLR
jgi:hypothetical protein